MTIDYHGTSYLEWLESLVLKTISPVNRGISGLSNNIKNYLGAVAEFKKAEEKNKAMSEEIEKLLQENAILKEKLITYNRLTKLLEIRESFSFQLIPAQVISREPGNWFNSIIIDKGSKDGVQKNMAIATYSGLVGKVISADFHSSKVLLILDQRSAVGSMIQRSRDIGVLKGSEKNYCYLEYLSRDADIKIGDLAFSLSDQYYNIQAIQKYFLNGSNTFKNIENNLSQDYLKLEITNNKIDRKNNFYNSIASSD